MAASPRESGKHKHGSFFGLCLRANKFVREREKGKRTSRETVKKVKIRVERKFLVFIVELVK